KFAAPAIRAPDGAAQPAMLYSGTMKRRFGLCAVAASALSMAAETAAADCLCRANGTAYEQGQLACIRMPGGPRLARCEKVLNNSSWRVLDQACQQMSSRPEPSRAAAALSTAPHPLSGDIH
ncbi:hypothetical protein, partial [Nitratireductor sp. ZSWI3]|uniref:hypothetical protein n=1 Tax=Nitratireductor sp. ZSWI3 TaxID=2966359 RepID=UPI002150058B